MTNFYFKYFITLMVLAALFCSFPMLATTLEKRVVASSNITFFVPVIVALFLVLLGLAFCLVYLRKLLDSHLNQLRSETCEKLFYYLLEKNKNELTLSPITNLNSLTFREFVLNNSLFVSSLSPLLLCLFIQPIFSILGLFLLGSFFIIQFLFYNRTKPVRHRVVKETEATRNKVLQTLNNIIEIKGSNLISQCLNDFQPIFNRYKTTTKNVRRQETSMFLFNFSYFAFCITLLLYAHSLRKEDLDLSFFFGMTSVAIPFIFAQRMVFDFRQFGEGFATIKSVFFLKRLPESNFNDTSADFNLNGALRLINFSLEKHSKSANEPSLNFELQNQQSLLIEGQNRSKKLALLNCLVGFNSEYSGEIYYGNSNLKNISPIDLRRHIGILKKEQILIPGSIYSNIVGARKLSFEEIWDTIDSIGLGPLILSLPMGLATLINPQQISFSQGEIQLILLARAVLGNPSFLFLDHPEQFLDDSYIERFKQHVLQFRPTLLLMSSNLSLKAMADKRICFD